MPHGRHIYSKASDMEKAEMCAYTKYDHALPHWKCVLRCLAKLTCYVEEHRSLGGSIISRLDNVAFVGLIYELMVFS